MRNNGDVAHGRMQHAATHALCCCAVFKRVCTGIHLLSEVRWHMAPGGAPHDVRLSTRSSP